MKKTILNDFSYNWALRYALDYAAKFNAWFLPVLSYFSMADKQTIERYKSNPDFEALRQELIDREVEKGTAKKFAETLIKLAMDNCFKEMGVSVNSVRNPVNLDLGKNINAIVVIEDATRRNILSVDSEKLKELCSITLTEKQQKAMEITEKYISDIAALGLKGRSVEYLIVTNGSGKPSCDVDYLVFGR